MTIAARQQAIWAKIESAYNTDPTPAGDDFVEVENLQPNPAESARLIERNLIQSSLAPRRPQYGGSLFGFTFDVEVKGSGSAGTAPRIGALLRACGLAETVAAGVSVTYEPSSDVANHDSVTIYYKEGPNLRKVTGCRGTVTFNLEPGQRIMASFTMMGHINQESQTSAPAQTAESTLPPPFLGASFQADSFSVPISALAVDLSNTMGIAPDPNASDGFGEIRVTARAIQGSFDPEAQGIATKDFIGQFRSATAFAIQTGVLGSAAGNRVAFSMPECQYTNVGYGEREALLTYDLSYGAYPTSSGDDDLAIQFT